MSDVTRIFSAIEQGDPHAVEQLLPLVYDELRRLAASQMAQERPDHTLNATALVHEAYMRLVPNLQFENRGHFMATAALCMKRILVENARARARLKRGGGRQRQSFDLDSLAISIPDEELLALNDALDRLTQHDPVKAQLVELHYFAGLSFPQVAEHLGVSLSTVERGWRYARAWLYAAMAGEEKSSRS